jgi:uncharacterized coiled-coil protein SlyX
MFEKMIEAAVEKALDRRTVRPDRKLTLEGYHPLSEIMGALYKWLFIPFRGTPVLVEVRYSRSTQLPDVDKLHAVVNQQKRSKKLSRKDMVDILNIQEECCKATLNRPTFEELEKAITGKDQALETNRRRLEAIDEKLKLVKDAAARMELQREKDRVELFCGYILPDDTMLALTNIALGMDVSDIRDLTREKLLAAYGKARLYGGRPSDFVPGIFTDGDRQNIDDYATVIGGEDEVHRNKNRPSKRSA